MQREQVTINFPAAPITELYIDEASHWEELALGLAF